VLAAIGLSIPPASMLLGLRRAPSQTPRLTANMCDNYGSSRVSSACPILQGDLTMGDLFQPMHLLVLGLIVLVLFGGKKLPELGKGLGEGLRGFKDGMKGIGEDDAAEQKKDADAKAALEAKAYAEAKAAADARLAAEARVAAEMKARENEVVIK
jgi:sec-independent protein translocase protein TatA